MRKQANYGKVHRRLREAIGMIKSSEEVTALSASAPASGAVCCNETSPGAIVRQRVRQRVRVRGVVQGVGFRPFAFTLAERFGLTGFVGNDSDGVFIEIEGCEHALDAFRAALVSDKPPLAYIESVEVAELAPRGDAAFAIVESQAQPGAHTLISPDLCICDDCLRELFDPHDRRYRYPFINCTNCGPRFTIIKDIPYDRPLTTMASFVMCADCAHEYHDPHDRRFHAQPVACPVCGPQVRLVVSKGLQSEDEALAGACGNFKVLAEASAFMQSNDAIREAQRLISQGAIVAVKGIGGFHLACDATNDAAVRRLRQRKGRVDKPFAVMMRDLDQVRRYADVNDEEVRLLTSRERPIVLLNRRQTPPLSEGEGWGKGAVALSPHIAPNNPTLGVMLPYSPLHYLLLEGMPPLVMTSGNLSDEPIVKDNDEALARLSSLADVFLLHDRDIHVWCDDSVVRAFEGRELPIRRSRGYAPFPVALPFDAPPLLATGGELKATFCLVGGQHAFMSQHIGDMENLETLDAFERAFEHMRRLFRVEPIAIACDKHPGYLSTRWAMDYAGAQDLKLVQVQHHHAHIASAMAEHGLTGEMPVIGFSFDGTGYGDDGAVWGGEVLVADYRSFRRVAHLKYAPLPGGDAAIKKPYRMALAHLWASGVEWDEALPCVAACPPAERRVLRQQLERNLNCVPTSSMGRLFDAVASLIGVRHLATYEAQGAIELEHIVGDGDGMCEGYALEWREDDSDPIVIDPDSLVRGVVSDLLWGVSPSIIAAKFHITIADLISRLALGIRSREGLNAVALSGGVFQNVRLLRLAKARLLANDFEVMTHHKVPPNDGGLALGQAAVAAAKGSAPCV